MAIITTKKAYIAIFLMGVIVVIAGISVYSITQSDTSQTPTTIFKELTEADEEIVKENIRSNIEQQKRKSTEKVDKKQPSYVDNEPMQNHNQEYISKSKYEAPIAKETESDVSDTEIPDLQSQEEEIQANISDIENLHKQFVPKDIDLGKFKTIKITTETELKKVIADLKSSGNPKHQVMIDFLENTDIDDNKVINVQYEK